MRAKVTNTKRREGLGMPLLTELGPSKGGLGYKHIAPDGAARPDQWRLSLIIAKNRWCICYFPARIFAVSDWCQAISFQSLGNWGWVKFEVQLKR